MGKMVRSRDARFLSKAPALTVPPNAAVKMHNGFKKQDSIHRRTSPVSALFGSTTDLEIMLPFYSVWTSVGEGHRMYSLLYTTMLKAIRMNCSFGMVDRSIES